MLASLAGLLLAPSLFAYVGLDGTLNFTAPTYQNGDGGEFNAATTGLGSFPTFCIEAQEYIGQPPSGPYTYTINTGAVSGGVGTDTVDANTGLPMDNISIGTAWLYSQFRAGTLTLDTGAGSYFDANRLANAGALQNAIWYLEDEGGQNNGYVTLAESALGLSEAQIKADSNGAYGVVALNLFDASGNLAQDQLALVLVPPVVVPEPSTWLLSAFGLSALGLVLRRR
ncbi:MAG TPA: PEP-CTERM sorting domain-containing protein [Candidatus Acidoferrum sp.]|nr:PEP-CTERM sorting domain-containing protein [Candidatus Acidoferrum sp.]